MPEVDKTVVPTNTKWEFNADVTSVFADMLSRSIPGYDAMRELTSKLAYQFATDNTWVIDLGCSQGGALKDVLYSRGALNRYLGLEISDPMIAAAHENLAGYIQTGLVEIRKLDLRHKFPPIKASVIQSIFTLQFVPIEHRMRVMRRVYDSLLPGGAFLFAEKILGVNSNIDDLMVARYLDIKRAHGYTEQQIQSKKESLEGVLVPLTAGMNESMIREAGFTEFDCYWRHLNFCAWLCVKR